MNSRKFIRNRQLPQVNDLSKYKDFNQVLSGARITKSVFSMFSGAVWITAAVVLAGAAILLYLNSSKEPEIETASLIVNPQDSVSSSPVAEKKRITPPLQEFDLPFTKYSFDVSKAYELHFETGSVLRIPAGAFEKLSGERVEGEVDVYYREFHDPVDFFLSGIPMTYDSAGVTYIFESAGMLDIRAIQNNDTLKLVEGKKIEVELATRNDNGTLTSIILMNKRENGIIWE